MAREMLINVSEGEECRIAIVEGGKLEELYMERASSTSHVGNIYKGRVTNVEPSIQAAFVDFGLGRNGFLHISDLMPHYFGRKGEDIQESVGRKIARRDRPPIQRCLRRGDDIIVQIIKEGIGTKGPTLSTYVSIPGRILVMMPGMSKFGVSRKIEDEEERKRLRAILDQLKPRNDVGFIIRTAGIGKTKTEIQRDLQYLTRLWQNIQKKLKLPAPQELYTEGDLVTRTVRDVFSNDIEHIIVDNKEVARKIKEFFKIAMPRTRNKVELHEEPFPLFHKYGIEKEIEEMYSRHVPLPSGGSLVIDSTEAIVAIDVNSGKFRDHADAEMTAFKTDMEAADEIPRQLRLRDLGGVIICDFIDLRYERHRRDLERKLHENLKKDRAKTKVLRMSQFGIIEMTRQRMRPSLKRSIYFDCPHCKGSGLVKTPESMSLDVMRRLAIAVNHQRVSRVELGVCPEVAFYLLNKKRSPIADLEERAGKRVIVRSDQQLGLDELKMDLFDSRDGLVFLDELGMVPGAAAGTLPDRHRRHQQPTLPPRGGVGGDRRGHQGPPQPQRGAGGGGQPGRREQQPPRRDQRPPPEVPHDLDEFEEAVDQREEHRAIEEAATVSSMQGTPGATLPTAALEPLERTERSQGPPRSQRTRRGQQAEPEVESHVIDVEEASEPLGEAPQEMAEGEPGGGGRRRRRRRGRRGRGRGGRAGDAAAPPAGGDAAADADEATDEEVPEGEHEVEDLDLEDEPEPTIAPEPSEEEVPEGEVAEGEEPADGGKRRRRRRGGRRHRRRKNGNGAADANGGSDDTTPSTRAKQSNGKIPVPADVPDVAPAEKAPRARSRRRGGARASAASSGTNEADTDQQPTNSSRRNEPARHTAPQRVPPPRVETPPIVKTGSTDRHLRDEPVLPETPARRPRSYRDLDAIPEDFD